MSFPKIVCLCGSTRFYQEFQEANYRETIMGKIVLTVGFYPHASEEAHSEPDPDMKAQLDVLHLQKIDMADEVFVVNPGGYIGESTRREIYYALARGKDIRYLEPFED